MENYKIKKTALISALLNNKKMFDDISDAFNSSPGSSKRERVSSMLKAFNTGIENTGKGGGIDPAINMTEPVPDMEANISMAPEQSSTVIFKGAPIKQTTTPGPTPGGDFTGEGIVTKTEDPSSQIRGTGIVDMGEGQIGAIKPETTTTDEQTDWGRMQDFGDSYLNEAWGNLSPEDKERIGPVFEAVRNNIGSELFAEKMLSGDRETLKQLTGLPDEVLPEGASKARNINKLFDTLKLKHNIEGLEDNMETLASRGLNIEQNLQDYVTGRDQYIEELDGLIDSTKDSMSNMDLSDIKVRKPMDSYMNYLYVLKGRQQKRYVDFVKMGIDYHNDELQRVKMTYDSEYKKFEEEFNKMSAVQEEDYDKVYSAIGNLYTMLENEDSIIMDKAKKHLEVIKIESEIASDIATRDAGFTSGKDYDKAFNNWQLSKRRMGVLLEDIKKEDFDKLPEDSKMFFMASDSDTVEAAEEEAVREQFINDIETYVHGIMSGDANYYTENGGVDYESIPKDYVELVKDEVGYRENLIDIVAKEIARKNPSVADREGGGKVKLVGMALDIHPNLYPKLKEKIKEYAKKDITSGFWSPVVTQRSVFTPNEIDWDDAELSYYTSE